MRGSRGKVRACIHNADRQTRRASAVVQDSEDSRPRWRTIPQTVPTFEIVFTRNRRMSDFIHATIMDQVELNG